MPHLRFRGLAAEHVQKLSESLNDELAAILNTSPDNFTVELIPSRFFNRGQADAGYPFVEVLWFERSPDEKRRCADHLTRKIHALAGPGDVAVVFIPIAKTDYFENGRHF